MKGLFLKTNSDDSMMRLMSFRVVSTACFISILIIVAIVFSVVWRILYKEEIESLTGTISVILGGTAGIIGTLLVPAFGGKVGQKFAEKKEEEVKK